MGKRRSVDHLQFNTYHMVKRLWKSVQRILRYFGSERTSLVQHKINCHGNIPWDIEKKFRSTQNAFIWCKNCKNRTWFMFRLQHKIVCHGNVPWGIRKTRLYRENSRKYCFFYIFLVIFNGRNSRPCSSEPNEPIFTKLSGLVDGCKGLLTSLSFFDFSRDVAMATN